jgi:hypothetical protein
MQVQERIEAIRRVQEHEVEAFTRVAEWERRRKEDLVRWKNTTLSTIDQSVQRVSEDFAARGSPFLFSSIPVQTEGSAVFRIKTNRGVRLFAKLQFDLGNGQVTASATVSAPHLPSSVPVGDVSSKWVELAAERVLIATLNAASNAVGVPIPLAMAQKAADLLAVRRVCRESE